MDDFEPPMPTTKQFQPPKRFLILANGRKQEAAEFANDIRQDLERAGAIVERLDTTGEASMMGHGADMAIVLGGDGAILRAAHQLGVDQVPVVGVNLGRLGFLAELSPEEFKQSYPAILRGEFSVTRHVIMEVTVLGMNPPTVVRFLNEVVISAGPPFRITDVELEIDGETITTISGDGVIVSTPIGSTAHSLAAGGPILRQDLPAVVITPICPHALTWRPLVEYSDHHFALRCPNASEGTTLIIDGHIQIPLRPHYQVNLVRSPVDFQLARLRNRSYYRTLTEKLHWGDRLLR